MANISISQMDTRAVANLSDLFEVAYADEQSSTGYGSGKMSAEVIANGIVNSFTYTSAMPNMGNRTLAGAMNTMLEGFAPAYDDTQTYAVGDYCTYAGKMYICSTAVSTAGAWDSTKWTETTCAEEFGTDVEVDSTLSTTSENPVQNKVITQNINSINANLVSEKTTAKADIVSISDAQDIPAEDVKADIEPIQDLHGYDYPWVGGAGKNIFDFESWLTARGVTYTKQGNAYTLTANSLIGSGNYWEFSDTPINVTLSATVENGTATNVGFRLKNTVNDEVSTKGSYITMVANAVYIDWTTSGTVTITGPQIEAGSTATTYAPYSNICPISGYTECEVSRTGINQWDEEVASGYYNANGEFVAGTNVASKNLIPCVGNTAYYFYGGANANSQYRLCFYDINQDFIERTADSYVGTSFTTPINARYMTFYMELSPYGTTYNNDISINYPSTITSYQAYSGQTYTVSFVDDQDASMTVYSGTLDVTTGVLTVDRVMVTFDGSVNIWAKSGNPNIPSGRSAFYTNTNAFPNCKNAINDYNQGNVIMVYNDCQSGYSSNQAKASTEFMIGVGTTVYNNTTVTAIMVNVDSNIANDTTAFNTWLQTNQIQALYPLATPQVYSLTPTQIDMLLNNNVLSASTGKIQVKYQPANVIGELKKLIYQLTNQ